MEGLVVQECNGGEIEVGEPGEAKEGNAGQVHIIEKGD